MVTNEQEGAFGGEWVGRTQVEVMGEARAAADKQRSPVSQGFGGRLQSTKTSEWLERAAGGGRQATSDGGVTVGGGWRRGGKKGKKIGAGKEELKDEEEGKERERDSVREREGGEEQGAMLCADEK